MEISIIFKIAALGIVITVLGQVLKHSGREEMTFLLSLARDVVLRKTGLIMNRTGFLSSEQLLKDQ